MGGDNSGFASMTKGRLKEVARKGGKNASLSGKKRQWSFEDAHAAAQKGVQTRMANLAREAFRRLINLGFVAEDITALGLTDKEIVYFGGRTAPELRREELRDKIAKAKG